MASTDTGDQQGSRSASALSGIKVLDLSRVLAGPWATQILGDLGADVLKIERPGKGDDTRTWGPPFVADGSPHPDAAYFTCINRNKRSVAIDFGRPEGAALVRRLAGQADVLLENFRPGTLARYGLDAPALTALNPRLIYCSVTGFGQTGPYATRGGYDFLIQAMSGLMSVTGRGDGEPGAGPMKAGIAVSDLTTSLYAAVAILGALHHRAATGEGQHIDCALLDSQVAVLTNQATNYLYGQTVPTRLGNVHPNVVPYRDFAAKDDYVIVACGNDGQFRALCKMLGCDDLLADDRYATNAGRFQHRLAVELRLARAISGWKAADFLRAMESAGVPGGPIHTIDQTLANPQVVARELLHTMTRDDGTELPMLGFPARLQRSPATYRLPPPRLGQDTRAVLAAELGLAEAELRSLADSGVIAFDRAGAPAKDRVVHP